MSKRITKSVLIQYSNVSEDDLDEVSEGESQMSRKQEQDEFEKYGKEFIKTLYSRMSNRTTLNVS